MFNGPSQQEIETLPRWAQVAFVARCARLISPLFRQAWPSAPEHFCSAVAQAVAFTEHAAESGTCPEHEAKDKSLAVAAAMAAAKGSRAPGVAVVAAQTAVAAVDFARLRAGALIPVVDLNFVVPYVAGRFYGQTGDGRFIRRDFDRLSELAHARKWDNNTPVPTTVFDLPIVAPTITPIRGVELELYAKPDTPPKAVEEALVDVYDALNRIHMAKGGGVLTVEKFRKMIAAGVLAPTGGD